MKTASAPYQAKTDLLQKQPAYKLVVSTVTGGIPSGTERAFSRNFVTVALQATPGVELVCLDAPQGNVQTVFPEQGQSSIGSLMFPLYDRDGEITRQIGNPKKGLLSAITDAVPATGGNLDANSSVDGYPARSTVLIDSERIRYTSLDVANNRFVNITRGVDGTTAAAHALGATIHNGEQLRLGTRAQLFAGYTDLNETDFMPFAKMEVVDIRLRQDLSIYEIVCADVQRFTRARIFTGATPAAPVTKTGNPVTLALQVLLTSTTVGKNHATYDVGDGNGLDLPQVLVDVSGLESLRTAEFPSDVYSFKIKEPQDAKLWLERQIWQTLNCIPFITQDGKYGAKRLQNAGSTVGAITKDHVIRVVGWRESTDRVINVLDFRYDFDLDGNANAFSKRRIFKMDDSITNFGVRPALVIESQGIKSANGGDAITENRAKRIADRWATPPPALELDLFYEKHLFDIGDQVTVTLPEVPDVRGVRSLTVEVFEIIELRPIFDPIAQAGVRVGLLWLAAVTIPPAPSVTTTTPGDIDRDLIAPATPTGLALTASGAVMNDGTFIGILDATWNANTEADLSHYFIRWRKVGIGGFDSAPVAKSATPRHIIRPLEPNTTYEVQVLAVDFANNASDFAPLTPLQATTPADPGLPAVPTGLTATTKPLAIVLSWNSNAESDIVGYDVQRADDTLFTVNVRTHRVDVVTYTDTPGDTVQRFYKVRAVRRSGALSAFTSSISVTASTVAQGDTNPTAPSTPSAPTFSSEGTYAASDGTSKAFITVNVAVLPSGARWQNLLFRRSGATEFMIANQVNNSVSVAVRAEDLTPGATYEFAVQAFSAFGVGSTISTSLSRAAPSDAGAPAVPAGLAISQGTGEAIELRWTANTESDLDEYQVFRNTVDNSATATKIADVQTTKFIDTNVVIGTTFFYWVKAVDRSNNASGFQVTSVSITVAAVSDQETSTASPATPSVPTFSADGTYLSGDGTVLAFITLNVAAEPSGARYQNLLYRRSGASDFLIADQLENTVTQAVRVDDLMPGIAYEFAVRAYSAFGVASATSATLARTAPNDAGAPAAPTAVTVAPGLQLNIIRFTPPTVADFDVVEVWRSTTNDSATATKVGESRGISFVDDKLANSTTYYYWLKSRDKTGNSSGFHATQFAGVAGTTLTVVTADITADAGSEFTIFENDASVSVGNALEAEIGIITVPSPSGENIVKLVTTITQVGGAPGSVVVRIRKGSADDATVIAIATLGTNAGVVSRVALFALDATPAVNQVYRALAVFGGSNSGNAKERKLEGFTRKR